GGVEPLAGGSRCFRPHPDARCDGSVRRWADTTKGTESAMSNPDPNDPHGQQPPGWGPHAGGSGQGSPDPAAGGPPNAWGQPAQPGQYGQGPAPQPGQYGQGPGPQPGQYGQQPGQYGPPQYGQQPGEQGQYAQYGQQPGQYGQYGPGGGAPQGWGPVPRPGIVPLRPLTLGEIYDGAIRSIRTNPAVMFVFSAILVALATAIEGVLTWSSFETLNSLAGMDPQAMQGANMDTLLASMQDLLVKYSISGLATFLITTILNGLLIHAVSQAVIGHSVTLAQVWHAVKAQIPRLLLLSVVVALMMVGLALVFVALFAAAAASGSAGLIGLMVIALIFLLLPGLLALATFTLLATPALVLERAGVGTALRRSFQLAKRSF